jgi:hypothetical protein
MLVQAFDFKSKDVKATFKVSHARFEGFMSGTAWLLSVSSILEIEHD